MIDYLTLLQKIILSRNNNLNLKASTALGGAALDGGRREKMKMIKILIIILYVCVIVMLPIGLLSDNKIISLIGYISLLIASILLIIKLKVEKNNKSK